MMWRPNRQTLMLAAAAGVGFFAFFVLFAFWTFPYEFVAERIIEEVERPRRADGSRRESGYLLDIDKLGPTLFMGWRASGVRLMQRPEPAATLADANAPAPEAKTLLQLDRVNFDIALLRLLFGTVKVEFDAPLGSGELEADVTYSADHLAVRARGEQVDLSKLGIIENAIGLPLKGELDLDGEVAMDADPKTASGHITLAGKRLALGQAGSKLKLPGLSEGITIDPIDAGTLAAKVDIKNGVGTIQGLRLDGPDVKVSGNGNLRLEKPAKHSRLELNIAFSLTERYKNKSERAQTMVSLLEINPLMTQAKRNDGTYGLRVSGTLSGRLTSSPAPTALP